MEIEKILEIINRLRELAQRLGNSSIADGYLIALDSVESAIILESNEEDN